MKPSIARLVAALFALSIIPIGAHAQTDPIQICQHVPITGAGPIVPRHSDRFGGFYFSYVNEELGGIGGRSVTMTTHDDQFYPAGARSAAERCARSGVDLLLGPFGHDQITSIGSWAQNAQVPYLHGGRVAQDDDGSWTASISPSSDEKLVGMADMLVLNARELSRGQPPVFGMVRIDSPYSQPPRDAFANRLRHHGYELAVDAVVQKDESQFTTTYAELKRRGVTVVAMLVNANIMLRMLNQQPDGYDPQYAWIVDDPTEGYVPSVLPSRRILALNGPAPVYDPEDGSSPWHAEMQEFLRIFRAYSPEQNPPPGDVDWAMYLRAKQVHRMLASLGVVDRESIRGLFSSYVEDATVGFPTCALDFQTTPHLGAHRWHVLANASGRWAMQATCASSGDPVDVSPPHISCGPDIQVDRIECVFLDSVSGIAEVTAMIHPLLTGEARTKTDVFACEREQHRLSYDPPGLVSDVSVEVIDCEGRSSTANVRVISTSA